MIAEFVDAFGIERTEADEHVEVSPCGAAAGEDARGRREQAGEVPAAARSITKHVRTFDPPVI